MKLRSENVPSPLLTEVTALLATASGNDGKRDAHSDWAIDALGNIIKLTAAMSANVHLDARQRVDLAELFMNLL